MSPVPPVKFLDRFTAAMRMRDWSATLESCRDWARRFILFRGKQHPADLGPLAIPPFLSQRTAAPLGSRTVQVICQRLLQPTGRFRRRSLSLGSSLGHFSRIMKTTPIGTLSSLVIAFALLTAPKAAAHCDTLDGPVVEDARIALKKGDVTPVLKWVSKDSEKEVREAFAAALKVRSLNDDARKLADMHFFETLVRVHRAGEGVPFTGLKPAGTIDPGFVVADKALSEGTVTELSADIAKSVQTGLHKRFANVLEKKKHADESVEAGRAYVAAYVQYAHYVEALHTLTSRGPEEHQHLHASDEHTK